MALKKALNLIQKDCKEEVIDFIETWFRYQNQKIDKNDIFIVWFAFVERGYKCMLSSKRFPNIFFEVTANKNTNDMACTCFERFEQVVVNGDSYQTQYFNDKPLRMYL